jgi:hypothetical protein
MGRTRGIFLLPPGTREQVLSSSAAFGRENKLRVEQTAPTYVRMGKGNENISKKRNIMVSALDMPQGVQVTIDAWLEDMSESSVDPKRGGGKRRKLWLLVTQLTARLGGPDPNQIFQHT